MVLPLLQVPPVVVFPNVVISPEQTVVVPEIAEGKGFVVTTLLVVQPVASVYVMTEVPGATPVTRPEPATMVAVAVLLLLHVPPVAPSFRFVVRPTQTTAVPDIAGGNGLTVTTVVAAQPVDKIYEMVAVPPVPTPVTDPVAVPTVATPVFPLLHVPPVVPSIKVVAEPEQTFVVPAISDGNELTVTLAVTAHPAAVL